jgi:hypothetical protein
MALNKHVSTATSTVPCGFNAEAVGKVTLWKQFRPITAASSPRSYIVVKHPWITELQNEALKLIPANVEGQLDVPRKHMHILVIICTPAFVPKRPVEESSDRTIYVQGQQSNSYCGSFTTLLWQKRCIQLSISCVYGEAPVEAAGDEATTMTDRN